MIDVNRTIKLVTGALFDREATWQDYLTDAGDWKRTAFLLTGPLIVVSALVAYLLSLLSDNSPMFAMFRPTLLSTAIRIVMGAIGSGVIALIFSSLAGAFGGRKNFALGLAAITLAFVPGYVGQALAWLPWVGGLLALGLGIFSLIQLWKIIPLYLEVPDSKRKAHYISSLVSTIIVMMLIGAVINPIVYGPGKSPRLFKQGNGSLISTPPRSHSSDSLTSGMFDGAIERAALLKEAMEEKYTPPADGRLTESQVQSYISVTQQVAKLQEQTAAQVQAAAQEADKDGELSIGDLGAVMKAANAANSLATSEMELVKRNGGNWAEHRWIAQSLLTASRQKNTNESIAHNYALYEKYREQLKPIGL